MQVSENILLRRFVQSGDKEAFSEIVKRYADPVYSTCRRILFDDAGAADAAQETFYQFMISAASIKGSLATWLHSVATNKAIDLIRHNAARRSRERRYIFSKSKEVNQWKDISPYIDRELENLSPQHREILLQYFFEGKTMQQIAQINKTSQPTISRTVTAALEELRNRLRKKGIIVALFILKSLVDQQTVQAAPAMLLTETAKMSLIATAPTTFSVSAGISSTAGLSTGATCLPTLAAGSSKTALTAALSSLKFKVTAAIVVTAIGTGGIVIYHHKNHLPQDTSSIAETQTVSQAEAPAPSISTQPILLSNQTTGGGLGGARMVSKTEDPTESVDLTDPESTIESFTDLLISDNLDLWTDCFIADSQALTNLYKIMTEPQNLAEQQLQNAYSSIGHPIEILDILQTKKGLAVTLLYTVWDPFTMDTDTEKHSWTEGDLFKVNFEMVQIAEDWKISNITTAICQN